MCFPLAHMLYIYCIVSQIKCWNAMRLEVFTVEMQNAAFVGLILSCGCLLFFKLICFLKLGFDMILKCSVSFDLLWFLQQQWDMLGNPLLLCLFMVENVIDLCNYKVGKMWPMFAYNVIAAYKSGRGREMVRWYGKKSILSVTVHPY